MTQCKSTYEFEILCNPVPWKAHGGYGRRSFNPRQLEKDYYQHQLKKLYLHNLPITAAVALKCVFYMPIPESASKKNKEMMLQGRVNHIKRPDTSNLLKFVEDTLKGIVIKDDSQVIYLKGRKFYSEEPRTVIQIDIVGFGEID